MKNKVDEKFQMLVMNIDKGEKMLEKMEGFLVEIAKSDDRLLATAIEILDRVQQKCIELLVKLGVEEVEEEEVVRIEGSLVEKLEERLERVIEDYDQKIGRLEGFIEKTYQ